MVADYVKYSIKKGWPIQAFFSDAILSLNATNVDNHFPENWRTIPLGEILSASALNNNLSLRIYPNPAIDRIYISTKNEDNALVEIFSPLGKLIKNAKLDNNGTINIDVSDFVKGVYLIKIGGHTQKVLILR
jgi:hypothetical protein